MQDTASLREKNNRPRKLGACASGALLAIGLWLPALSGQAAVKITNCTVTKPSNLVFITNLVTGLTSATTFNVSCTTNGNGGTANITIGLSAGFSGSSSQRIMKNGSNTLTYNLYQDPQHIQVWGTTSNELVDVNISGNISSQPYTIYGKIDSTAANMAAPAGNYSDASVILTISY